jgi:Tfp pilus assembly protein PilV
MSANTTQARVKSASGERLIAVLVVAIVVLGILTAYPALAAETKGTADRAQQRVNMPLIVASQLDEQAASPYSP